MKPLDLKQMQIDYTVKNSGTNKVRVKREIVGSFLRGPIPLVWLEKAACLGGKTLHVAISLWFLRGVTNRNLVRFNQSNQERFGVKRDAARRSITALESAGLISVTRKPGRCLEVLIIDLDGRKP